MNQEEGKSYVLQLIEDLKSYTDLRFQILVLDLSEKVARVFASIVSKSIIVFFLACSIFFGSFAAAFALSTLFNNNFAIGFLLVSLFNLLIGGILLLIVKKYIEQPLIDRFIQFLFKNGDENEKD